MDDALIELSNYSFHIGRKEILKSLSLSVHRGEFLSIIGPNGAGKTTLLKCLDRILPGGEGSIRLCGKGLNKYSQRELAKLMSYVPQADGRSFPYTVYEFVMMGRYPHLSPFSSIQKKDKELIKRALSLTGTVEFSDRYVNTLSGGERQKVFVAAALAQEAEILLLDEPTTFLDPKHQDETDNLLRQLNRDYGVTIIAVTHALNSAVQWSNRILALKGGEVAYLGSAEKIMSNEVLEKIYDKTFLFVPHPQTGTPVIVPDGRQS